MSQGNEIGIPVYRSGFRFTEDHVVALCVVTGMAIAYGLALEMEVGVGSLAGYALEIFLISAFTALSTGCGIFAIPAVLSNPRAPATRMLEIMRQRGWRDIASSIGLLFLVLNGHGAYTLLKRMIPVRAGFPWDASMAQWDRWLHGGDPWRIATSLPDHPLLLQSIMINYSSGWAVYVMGVLAWICMSETLRPARARLLTTYLAVLFGMGVALGTVYASAGPVFYSYVTGDTARYAELESMLEAGGHGSVAALALRDYLWAAYQANRLDLGTGISAFPSVHVATATFAAWVVLSQNRWAGLAAFAYVGLIIASAIALGWHYGLDCYLSFAIASILYGAIGALWRTPKEKPA